MLYRYILEFKSRILLIIVSWIVTFLICYNCKEILLFLLIKLNIKLYCLKSFYFISTNLTDVFSIYIQLSYFITNQLSIFLFFYHFLVFISPGLFKSEYKAIKLTLFLSTLFFFLSFCILNNVLLPYIWSFFLSFQNNQSTQSINIFFEAQITEYFKFYIYIHYITFIISQSFVLIVLILNFIENKINFVSKTRKVIYSSFLIIATVITPPDILSQICICLCFILVYEFFIIIIILKTVINGYV